MEYLITGALVFALAALTAVIIRIRKNADDANEAALDKENIANAVRRVMEKDKEYSSTPEQATEEIVSGKRAYDFRVIREIMYTDCTETIDGIRTVILYDNI